MISFSHRVAQQCSPNSTLFRQPLTLFKMVNQSRGLSEQSKALGKLRKKTGYSLSICKKALNETNNDLAAAEKWLKDQAQAHGWAKAMKLQGRNTSQGLLGVKVSEQIGALVELNCETDFVANNSKFKKLLEDINLTCLRAPTLETGANFVQRELSEGEVGELVAPCGTKLSDLVALGIGQLGENLRLGGAVTFQAGAGSSIKLACLSHPNISRDSSEFLSGRYAALLAYTGEGRGLQGGVSEARLASQLCQHIIGMAPTSVCKEGDDAESQLINQTFLLDEDLKVGELLTAAGMEVHGFIRKEVGRGGSD